MRRRHTAQPHVSDIAENTVPPAPPMIQIISYRYFHTKRRLGGAVRHFVRNTPPAAVKSVCNLSAIYGLLK